MLSGFGSLYLIPKDIAPDDCLMLFSAFSISYDPGAVGKKKTLKF